MRRLAIVTFLVTLVSPLTALGGGMTSMRSPDDFVEPGETVEMVAYENVSSFQFSQAPWVAQLSLTSFARSGEPDWLRVGEVHITPVTWSGYGTHRLYVTFVVPADLATGEYGLRIVNETGDELQWVWGYLKVGLPVGQEESQYEWPLDEPLVAKLPFWATLVPTWPGVLVKDIRAGRYPPDAAQYLLDPSVLDGPGIVFLAPTTTTAPFAQVASTTTPKVTTTVTMVETTPTALRATRADSVVEPGALPAVVAALIMLVGVGALVWLAARGREMHVVLGGRPITSPPPTDGSEGLDDHITTDNQARH